MPAELTAINNPFANTGEARARIVPLSFDRVDGIIAAHSKFANIPPNLTVNPYTFTDATKLDALCYATEPVSYALSPVPPSPDAPQGWARVTYRDGTTKDFKLYPEDWWDRNGLKVFIALASVVVAGAAVGGLGALGADAAAEATSVGGLEAIDAAAAGGSEALFAAGEAASLAVPVSAGTAAGAGATLGGLGATATEIATTVGTGLAVTEAKKLAADLGIGPDKPAAPAPPPPPSGGTSLGMIAIIGAVGLVLFAWLGKTLSR